MTLIDANVLLYAYDSESPFQKASARWLETELSSGRSVSFALVTLLAFVRIAADRRVFSRPLTPAEACSLIEGWLALPNARLLQPGRRTWKILSEVCGSGQARGPMVMDAHLSALALEHGASIATTDRDFTRFPGIDLVDPTEATSHQASTGSSPRRAVPPRTRRARLRAASVMPQAAGDGRQGRRTRRTSRRGIASFVERRKFLCHRVIPCRLHAPEELPRRFRRRTLFAVSETEGTFLHAVGGT